MRASDVRETLFKVSDGKPVGDHHGYCWFQSEPSNYQSRASSASLDAQSEPPGNRMSIIGGVTVVADAFDVVSLSR